MGTITQLEAFIARAGHSYRYSDDQPRDESGRFGEGSGGSSGDSTTGGSSSSSGASVRESLRQANTTEEVAAAAASEAKSITGRDIQFDYQNIDPQLAREYSEGVLQGLDRFPEAPLGAVRVTDFEAEREAGEFTYAHTLMPDEPTVTGQYEIEFNRAAFEGQSAEDISNMMSMKQARGSFAYGDVRGLAVHEFGHVMHESYGTAARASSTAREWARAKTIADNPPPPPPRQSWWRPKSKDTAPTGPSSEEVRITLMRELSSYAASNSHELAAEAFADAMVNGDSASPVSLKIMDDLDSAVRGGAS